MSPSPGWIRLWFHDDAQGVWHSARVNVGDAISYVVLTECQQTLYWRQMEDVMPKEPHCPTCTTARLLSS